MQGELAALDASEIIPAAQATQGQAEFQSHLERLPAGLIHGATNFASQLAHDGTMSNYDPDRPAFAQGFHLDPEALGHSGELPTSLGFTPQRLPEIGRTAGETHSRNGTFFGILNATGADGTLSRAPVAVKPIQLGGLDRSKQEVAMLAYARERSLPVPELIGIFMDHESAIPTAYVITRRNREIQSLDNLDWTREAANATSHLQVAVSTLVALHKNLLFHRDLEFKNLSSLDREGSFIAFDLEWAISLADIVARGGEEAVKRLSAAIERDLGDVRRSMKRFIYPNLAEHTRPSSAEEELDYELATLYEPYHLALMSSDSPHIQILDHAYRRALERRRAGLKKNEQ